MSTASGVVILSDTYVTKKSLQKLYNGILLQKAIASSIRDQGLQHWPNQVDKVKQLHNQILVRHGVMLVGPTGGGKTAVRNILQRALVLLPTITMDELESLSSRIKDQRKISLFTVRTFISFSQRCYCI